MVHKYPLQVWRSIPAPAGPYLATNSLLIAVPYHTTYHSGPVGINYELLSFVMAVSLPVVLRGTLAQELKMDLCR